MIKDYDEIAKKYGYPRGFLSTDGRVTFTPITPKPILVICGPMTLQDMDNIKNQAAKALHSDYHVLVLFSDKFDIKVFSEKDQIELDKEKLEELLSFCKS